MKLGIEIDRTKRVILTLDELATIAVISRAKAMKVGETTLNEYIEQTKDEFLPMANHIHETQVADGTLDILKPKLVIVP